MALLAGFLMHDGSCCEVARMIHDDDLKKISMKISLVISARRWNNDQWTIEESYYDSHLEKRTILHNLNVSA